MRIPPTYTINPQIERLLTEITTLSQELGIIQVDNLVLKYHRQRGILKSSLYSARIEGSPLGIREVENVHLLPKSKVKIELTNLVQAIELVDSQTWEGELTKDDLKRLHQLIMANLDSAAGHFRTEPSAIYNSAGIAVYVCPPAQEIVTLTEQLLFFINNSTASPPPIRVALAHYAYEKIHPFLDGNGRVGRALMHLLMKKYGYNLRGISAFEQYIDNHRSDYYDLLGADIADITDFVVFILESFVYGLQQGVTTLSQVPAAAPENRLLPRRQEILAMIKDHPQISFDSVRRRFMAIPPRTLRYDLKYLSDRGYILKLGTTRGVLYSPKYS